MIVDSKRNSGGHYIFSVKGDGGYLFQSDDWFELDNFANSIILKAEDIWFEFIRINLIEKDIYLISIDNLLIFSFEKRSLW